MRCSANTEMWRSLGCSHDPAMVLQERQVFNSESIHSFVCIMCKVLRYLHVERGRTHSCCMYVRIHVCTYTCKVSLDTLETSNAVVSVQ
jgi:hypothetical protein